MKQGFLLKHLNMAEFDLERALIDKVVECNHCNIQSRERVRDSRMSMKTRLRNDTNSKEIMIQRQF
jgi:hypothetical protein